MTPSIPGLTTTRVSVGGRETVLDVGGTGPAVLLLHGFPQTRLTWRSVAPRLTERFRVLCADLPGYGDSARLGDGYGAFDKAKVADHLVGVMRSLGHCRFAVVGHDRGALVAFRAALDHPDAVTHLGVLDVLPTVDMWAALRGVAGVFAFHLYLLAQPTDLPERLVAAAPEEFFGYFLDAWTKEPGAIPPEVRAHYLAAAGRPEAIQAICDDYRASAFLDGDRDEHDRRAGRRLTMPVLAAWQDPGDQALPFDPERIWAAWATDPRTLVLPCGHFLPEERPEAVADAIVTLVTGRSSR
jgi:pimeloyl-ACP methyl ester carboxylesterase